MEKKAFGTILTILGIAGLIIAAYYFAGSHSKEKIRAIIVYAVLGAVFFFAGIGLIRTTRDRS
jgi:uncharacterized membrane protein